MYLKEEIEILTLKLLPHIWSFSFIIPVKAGWHWRLFPSCRPHLHLTHHTHTHPNTCHLSSVLGLWCDLSHQSSCGGSCLIKIKKATSVQSSHTFPGIMRNYSRRWFGSPTGCNIQWELVIGENSLLLLLFFKELNREKMTSKILDFGVTPPVFVKIDNDNWLKM